MLTREQQYAATIYALVVGEKERLDRPQQKKYGAMAHKLPVLIRVAGLAQALQFVESRGKTEHKTLLQHLALTLGFADDAGDNAPTAKDKLLASSRGTSPPAASLAAYMRLTQQALDALQWYKRFAQSVLEVEASDDGAAD